MSHHSYTESQRSNLFYRGVYSYLSTAVCFLATCHSIVLKSLMVTILCVTSAMSGTIAIFNRRLPQPQHKLILIFFASRGPSSICITMKYVNQSNSPGRKIVILASTDTRCHLHRGKKKTFQRVYLLGITLKNFHY